MIKKRKKKIRYKLGKNVSSDDKAAQRFLDGVKKLFVPCF